MIKISKTVAVNPKHVLAVMLDSEKLVTKVVFPGMTNVVSEFSFEETVNLLNAEIERSIRDL